MIIISDSREQLELDFSGLEGVEKVETMGLAYGDYTAIIHEKSVPIVFERKGFSDLWGTMTTGYDRFKKELERAKADNIKLVLIIEGTYSDVWNGFERSQFQGNSMLKKLAMLYVRYDLEYIFCENRRVMARRICDTYSAIERNWGNGSSIQTNENAPLASPQTRFMGSTTIVSTTNGLSAPYYSPPKGDNGE
jgi:ERCC4-type nuclease